MDNGDNERPNEHGENDSEENGSNAVAITDRVPHRARNIYLLADNLFCKSSIYKGDAPYKAKHTLVKQREASNKLLLLILQPAEYDNISLATLVLLSIVYSIMS